MKGRDRVETATAKAAHELQETARIGGDDSFGVGGEKFLHFAIAELTCGLRIKKIVDTGRATAETGFFDVDDFEAWDGREKTTWLLIDCLSVTKMAGIVIGDSHG